MYEGSSFFIFSATLDIVINSYASHSCGCVVAFHCVFFFLLWIVLLVSYVKILCLTLQRYKENSKRYPRAEDKYPKKDKLGKGRPPTPQRKCVAAEHWMMEKSSELPGLELVHSYWAKGKPPADG